MLIRVAALGALLASLIGCTPDSGAAPPSGRSTATSTLPGNVPAARWHAVLIAGDNNSPSFDNGIDALRDYSIINQTNGVFGLWRQHAR